MPSLIDHILALQEDSDALIAVFDQDDRLRHCNAAYRKAYCVDAGETPLWVDLMRRNHQFSRGPVIETDNIDAWLTSALARRGKLPKRAFEVDLHDGRWLWLAETMQSDGWMLSVAMDITELRMEERQLRQNRDSARRASQTDDLTGIANRRYVMSVLDAVLAGMSHGDIKRGCVAVLDIDLFKQVNDSYGHLAGDEVLKDFVRAVQSCIRARDGFGRIGGEEFLLILPDARMEQAKAIVNRILSCVRARRPLGEEAAFSYTCSAGLAEILPTDTSQTVYARADRALYAAKNGGRDRMIMAA